MSKVQVRYIVNDVDSAIRFCTEHLGFKLVMHSAHQFDVLSYHDLRLVLSSQILPAAEVKQCPMVLNSCQEAGINFPYAS